MRAVGVAPSWSQAVNVLRSEPTSDSGHLSKPEARHDAFYGIHAHNKWIECIFQVLDQMRATVTNTNQGMSEFVEAIHAAQVEKRWLAANINLQPGESKIVKSITESVLNFTSELSCATEPKKRVLKKEKSLGT